MRRVIPLFLLAFATNAAWLRGSQITISGSPSTLSCVGYLPYPCGAQHLAVRQESPLYLTINGTGAGLNVPAGTIFIDPDFGERTLRVTDANTLPGCFNTTSQNIAVVGPDNPDLSVFSSNTLWFRALDLNSNDWLFQFNPSTMQVACAPVASTTLKALPWYGEFGRTAANAGTIFGPMSTGSGTPWVVQTYNVTQYSSSSNVPVKYYDFSTCAGLSWLSTLPIKTIQWFPGMWLSSNDNRIMWTFGPVQNEGWLSAIYDKSQNQCVWVDSRTGQIGGNLTTTGTMSGEFPLDWGSTRAPSAPTVSQTNTASGTLMAGHTYDICYSLAWETNQEGVGETSCSAVQRVAITTGSNAVSIPSPAQCSTIHNCDIATWSYYNIYANDEANCGGAQCPTSSLYLQPAANLGCTQAVPTLSITQSGTSGSAVYSYIVQAYGPHCMTFAQQSTSTGNATLSSTNYNIVTPGSVSGAGWYRISQGGKGNVSAWSSTVYGTASVDAASPSGGGTPMFPAEVRDSSSASAYNDQGSSGLGLDAMGTIPCYDNMPYGSTWSNLFSLSSSSQLYNCNNNTTLVSLTSSGPTAPSKSTLGLGIHAAIMSRDGSTVKWGTEPNSGSDLIWQVGTTVAVLCNLSPSVQYPTANAYVPCGGHGLTGTQGITYNSGLSPTSIGFDANFQMNYRTFASFAGNASGIYGLNTFPAPDPNGIDYYDQHQSWNSTNGTDQNAAILFSTDTGSSASLSSFQGPLYIGRGLAREIYTMNPNGTFSRFAHHRASGVPYYTTNLCGSGSGRIACEQYGWESQATISDDGKWAMYTSDMNASLGCDPTQSFPITAVSVGSPTTITISIPSGNAAPLANQVGTVIGTSGVAGLNAQWTLTGTSPVFTLSGSSLSGTIGSLTGAQFQECTYNGNGQVNGPLPASNCGTGSQTCKTGMSLRSVFITELK